MSRASALEVRWAPGKRDARAHWGPVLQRLRTIGRSAPVSGRALAHARPRAQPLGALRPGAGVVGRPDPGQAERTPGAITPTALGALHNRVAATQEVTHRREAAPPGALRPFPAVGAHGRGAGGGRQRVGLLGTRAGGGLQRVGGGRLGHGSAEGSVLSTWTEIFPQNPSRFHYHHGDDMKEASNPWKATWHHPPISETIQR